MFVLALFALSSVQAFEVTLGASTKVDVVSEGAPTQARILELFPTVDKESIPNFLAALEIAGEADLYGSYASKSGSETTVGATSTRNYLHGEVQGTTYNLIYQSRTAFGTWPKRAEVRTWKECKVPTPFGCGHSIHHSTTLYHDPSADEVARGLQQMNQRLDGSLPW